MATTGNQAGAKQWDNKELGVLWSKQSKSGEKYLTGTLNLKELGFDQDVPVVVFKNKNKKKDTHPDLRIYLSERRDSAAAPRAATPAPTAAPAKKAAAPKPAPVEEAPAAPDEELI